MSVCLSAMREYVMYVGYVMYERCVRMLCTHVCLLCMLCTYVMSVCYVCVRVAYACMLCK